MGPMGPIYNPHFRILDQKNLAYYWLLIDTQQPPSDHIRMSPLGLSPTGRSTHDSSDNIIIATWANHRDMHKYRVGNPSLEGWPTLRYTPHQRLLTGWASCVHAHRKATSSCFFDALRATLRRVTCVQCAWSSGFEP